MEMTGRIFEKTISISGVVMHIKCQYQAFN